MRIIGYFVLFVTLAVAGVYVAFRWFGSQTQASSLIPFKEPKVDLYGFSIKSISLDRTIADVQLLIENTSPVSLEADSLQYEVFVEGTEITRGSYTSPIRLKARDTTMITLPVTLHNQQLFRAINRPNRLQPDSIACTLKAKVFTGFPLLKNKPLQIQLTRKMPMNGIPDLRLLEDRLKKLGYRPEKRSQCMPSIV